MNDDTVKQDATGVALAVDLSRRAENKPATVPGFTLLKSLGEGAYGTVWLAREENTGKQVAIKFYTHHRGLDWSLLNREVEKLAVLYTSRNIVRLLGVGWDSDPPYYVMEYLENGSLASFLQDGPIPPQEAVRIAKSIAQALVHAHGSGILHCDLKPANILLDADFEPRICDFGQSRLSNEQSPALGTLFYMAPEQADLNAVPDARWDVYAMGALLYHLACGHAPYWSEKNETSIRLAETLDERLSIYRRILKTNEPPAEHRKVSGVDRRLAEIIDRCLRIDPQKRFSNAQAVLDALELRERQRARRPLMLLGIVGPAVLLMAMAIIVNSVTRNSVENARDRFTARALESDVQPAKILAGGLRPKIQDKISELEEVAGTKWMRDAIRNAPGKSREERIKLFTECKQAKDEIFQELRARKRPVDFSWIASDANGWQWWRDPFDDNTDTKNYAFRDYFHGTRKDIPEKSKSPFSADDPTPYPDVKPIRAPHVSQAFRSRASSNRWMVAISVPIWDEEGKEVIGVLARTTLLEHLLDDYGEGIRGGDEVDRVVGLIQCSDGKILNHPALTDEKMKELSNQLHDELAVSEPTLGEVQQLLAQEVDGNPARQVVRAANYVDPIGSSDIDPTESYAGEWLAAFVRVEGTGWAAVVQERRDLALMPIVELHSESSRSALAGLVASCALVGALWYFVFRALSDRPVGLGSGRGNSNRPSEKGSTV